MTEEEKLEICRRCAGALIKRVRRNESEFDELVAVGFLGMKSDIKKLAFSQAYLHMMNFIRRKLTTHPDIRLPRVCIDPDLGDYLDLNAALGKLSAEEKDVIDMRFFKGLKLREIGEVLGMEKQSVSVKLDKVLKKLKGMLDK